jgi:hypothetical protein
MRIHPLMVLSCAGALGALALAGCGSKGPAASGGAGGGTASTSSSSGTGGVGTGGAGGSGGGVSGPITTHPTNILVNGGFELGMMCFGEYVQPDGNNDYGYFLSPDAHSGKYALELRCLGPSCASSSNNRAFVITQAFHAPANQAYKLTAWSRCDAGADAFWYTESAAMMYLSQPLQCTGAWAQNEIHFTAKPTDGDATFYFYNHSAGSLFLDDLVLTFEDGTVPAHTVKHPGVRQVAIKPDHLEVDQKPYLALGFFNVPQDELAEVAAIPGANVVTTLGPTALADCFNTDRQPYADAARELGLDVMPDLTTTARLGVPEVFPAVMDAFAPHLANIGFYLADEPDQGYYQYSLVDPVVMAQERAAAHTRSALPLLADLQHAHYDPPAVDQPFQDSMDIYGSEPYQEDTSGITQTFAVFSTMTKRPVWLFDDNHADVSTVVPKAYFSVIAGATGLLWFDWPSLDAANRAADAQAIGELRQLEGAIFGADAATGVTAPAGVAFLARKAGGKTYLLAVNPTAGTAQGNFTVSGLAAAKVEVMFESRSIPVSGGSFSDTFTGISRHVYVF